MPSSRLLLIAEDDENDVFLLQHAFDAAKTENPVRFVKDGQEAIDYISKQCMQNEDTAPSLVMLDLKMPRKSGFDVLEWMRKQPVLQGLPVFMFTSSTRQEDIDRAYLNGATGFLVKPPSTSQRLKLVNFLKDWLACNELPSVTRFGVKAARQKLEERSANSSISPPL